MSAYEFLQAVLQRTGANAANLRAVQGEYGCDMHLFFGESVLSYWLDAADLQTATATVEGVGQHVDAARERAGGRL